MSLGTDSIHYQIDCTCPKHSLLVFLLLFLCGVKIKNEPQECMMGTASCLEMLAGWAVGNTGQCYNPQAGFPMGKNGPRVVSMQLHWNNPTEVDTWYDSSGIILYYTPKLRRYNAGILWLGQLYLNIPPGQPSVVQEGTCTSHCTNKVFRGPIQVFTSIHHMHFLGIRQNVTLTRPGGAVEMISEDNPYSYDNPQEHTHEPAVTVNPGDELKISCTFQSRSRTTTTTNGDGSFDEMCLAFLSYYPADNLTERYCYKWKDSDMFDVCDFNSIVDSTNASTAAMIDKVIDSCDSAGTCRAECPAAIEEVRAQSGCFREAWDFLVNVYMNSMENFQFMRFVAAMESCGGRHSEAVTTTIKPPVITTTVKPPVMTTKPHDPSMPMSDAGSLFLNIIKPVDVRPLLQNIVMNVNYNSYGKISNDGDDHVNTYP